MARREDTSHLDAALNEPEDRQTLAESITGRLRQLILDGQLPPGQSLRPADLAPRLGVSVMPVREALRILEAEGLVTFKPRIGARVAEIDAEDVEELYLVRGALEGLAARLAVKNLTDEDLLDLHEAFDEMTAARASDDFDDLQPLGSRVPSTPFHGLGPPGPGEADPRHVGLRSADLRHRAAHPGVDGTCLRGAPGDPGGARQPRRARRRTPHADPHRGGGGTDPRGPPRAERGERGRGSARSAISRPPRRPASAGSAILPPTRQRANPRGAGGRVQVAAGHASIGYAPNCRATSHIARTYSTPQYGAMLLPLVRM